MPDARDGIKKSKGYLEYIDSHLTQEINTKIHAKMEYLNIEMYKNYRVYIRLIEYN